MSVRELSPPSSPLAASGRDVLALAGDLLASIGSGDEAANVCSSIAATERDKGAVVAAAAELVDVCERLAVHAHRLSPAAFACAKLAHTAAELATEAWDAEAAGPTPQALSRRARRLVAIRDIRADLDRLAVAADIDSVQAPAAVSTHR